MKPRWEWCCVALALFAAPFLAAQFAFKVDDIAPPRGLEQLAPGTGVPEIGTVIVGLLVLAAFVGAAWRLPVFRFPSGSLLLVSLLFWGLLLASVVGTAFPETASKELVRWSVYSCAFLLVAGISGRGRYALVLGGVVALAGSLEALLAVREYTGSFRADPNWRVFGTFFNPDFLAGYLVLVIPLCLAFLGRLRGTLAPIAWLLLLMPLPALTVTGSRGGLLAGGLAIVAFALLAWWNRVVDRRLALSTIGAVLVGVAVFLVLSSQGGSARVVSGGGETSHSVAFRRYLWQDAAAMIADKPFTGSGIGTFVWAHGPHAKIGFTRLAHNSYLQLGAEAGVPALGVFAILLAAWFFAAFPRGREVRQDEAFLGVSPPLLRSAIIAGAIGALAHNLIDSDLSLFANGLTFWAMLGLGLAVSLDGVAPLFLPRAMLGVFASAVAVVAGTSLFRSAVGASLATTAQAELNDKRYEQALGGFEAAVQWQPDNRQYLIAEAKLFLPQGRLAEAEVRLWHAAEIEPSAETFVAIGRLYLWAKAYAKAEEPLKRALIRDPMSVSAQGLLLKLYELKGRESDRLALAERVVAQRHSLYARVRAVPEVVETLYADCDMMLARANPMRALPHLTDAFADYTRFMRDTYPMVISRAEYPPVSLEATEAARQSYFECARLLLSRLSSSTEIAADLRRTSDVVEKAYTAARKKDEAERFRSETEDLLRPAGTPQLKAPDPR